MSSKPRRQRQHSDEEIAAIAAKAERRGDYYAVPSSDGTRTYKVTPFFCTCPASEFGAGVCKHRQAIELLCPPVKFEGSDPFTGF